MSNVDIGLEIRVMVLNATFNNISVILWQSVLLLEETGVPGENHRPVASHWQILAPKLIEMWLEKREKKRIFGRFCIKFTQNKMTGEQHRLNPLSL